MMFSPRTVRTSLASVALVASGLAACSDSSGIPNGTSQEAPPTTPPPAGPALSGAATGEETYSQVISSGYRFGQYLYFNQDWGWTHTFPQWNTSGVTITSAKLIVRAWDVDAEPFWGMDGEYDAVSVDGTRLNPGFLQGSNATWSVTTFDVPVGSINDDGQINVWLDIDLYHNYARWATQLNSSELRITYTSGPPNDAPFMPTVVGSPGGAPGDGQDLSISVTGPTPADPDEDAVTYEYRWFLNTGNGGFLDPSVHGRPTITGATVPASATQPGDEWRVQVTPRDARGAIGPFATYTFAKVTSDATPPVITPTVTGSLGSNGWYTSNVAVTWSVTDAESAISSSTGCSATSVTSDTDGVTFTCSAMSAGGSASESVTIKRDATAPSVTAVIAGTAGSNGWYTSDVSVSWNVSDAGSGVTSSCSAASVTADGTTSHACTATDNAGNSASGATTVNRDATDPSITWTGATSYTVDQSVVISCSASDATSGIASSSCATTSGPAYTFSIGANALSATASDNAGNSTTSTSSFTVSVTEASLCALVNRWTSNAGVANSLCTKLENAAAAGTRGNTQARGNMIDAFISEVLAQAGKKIDAANAATLARLARAL